LLSSDASVYNSVKSNIFFFSEQKNNESGIDLNTKCCGIYGKTPSIYKTAGFTQNCISPGMFTTNTVTSTRINSYVY